MPISADSTLPELHAAFENSADYDLVGGVAGIAKAKDLIHSGRILLRRRKDEVGAGSDRIRFNNAQLQAAIDQAWSWLQSQDGFTAADMGISYADLRESRR